MDAQTTRPDDRRDDSEGSIFDLVNIQEIPDDQLEDLLGGAPITSLVSLVKAV